MQRATAVLVFTATVACWPAMLNFAMAPRWAVLSVGLPLLVWWAKPSGRSCVAMSLALLWGICSLQWAPNSLAGIWGVWQLALLSSAFLVGNSLSSLELVAKGLLAGIAVNSAVVLSEVAGFSLVPSMAPPSGLFANRGVLAGAAAVTLVLGLALRVHWIWLLGAIPALVFTSSRAAVVGLSVAASVWMVRRLQAWLGVACWWVVLIVGYVVWKGELFWNDTAIGHRLAVWLDMLPNLRWEGHGVGQFESQFPLYNLRLDTSQGRMEFAHNDPLQFAFELGVGASFLAWAIVRSAWRRHPVSYALMALLAVACFDFPLHLPHGVLLCGLLAGWLSRGGAAHGKHPSER